VPEGWRVRSDGFRLLTRRSRPLRCPLLRLRVRL
jgi:hypothetical protein